MKSDTTYKKTVLRNGLRVVSEKIPAVRSVSLGVWVNVGSRYEAPDENGMSHLIEHMLFKGTKKRSAKQIAEVLESVGGQMNAFTSREQTCYMARFLDDKIEKGVDVLADITCNSRLTPSNLRMEKMVIREEIKEAFDNPADRVHDVFAETLWDNHPLGMPILGKAENVINFPRAKILNYLHRNYLNKSILIAASGNVSHRRLVDLSRKYFHFERGITPEAQSAEPLTTSRKVHLDSNGEQTHVCLGYQGPSYSSHHKMAALATSCYLGGGMSSVLFQKIREQKGLAYSVYTFLDFYRDTGVVGTYVGTDRKHVAESIDIILRELDYMKKRRLSSHKLQSIKDQLRGQLTLGMESTSAHMNRIARQELYLGQFRSFNQTLDDIYNITSSDILSFANETFDPSAIALATLGPIDKTALKNVL
ncbi:MAG: pitrilysin family protein [candidate division Zixibacteria bacterium]|nr:pitrilysin family protein [candidate division Zixibacteria bacterium]